MLDVAAVLWVQRAVCSVLWVVGRTSTAGGAVAGIAWLHGVCRRSFD